jgi:UDP-3-O-[3-hydroxymyristoyl] glucosamine N-acyltransferase
VDVENWIDPSAKLGAETKVGHGVVIEAGASIGAQCVLGHHVASSSTRTL